MKMISEDYGVTIGSGIRGDSSKMRLTQIISSTELEGAGTTVCVRRLARSLAAQGQEVDLLSTGVARELVEKGVRLCTRPFVAGLPGLHKLRVSEALRREITRCAQAGAVLHSHGLWLMPNVYPSWVARREGAPLVVSPHGMLAPEALAFSATRKKVFAALLQRRALQLANCIHVTSRSELEDVRAFDLKAPVAVVPHGVDMPDIDNTQDKPDKARTILYLGRLHPKKAIDNLISAFARIASQHPNWRLRIVGPAEGDYGEKLQALCASLCLPNVSFEDGLFGAARDAAYAEADVFVLPTQNENFGMVVAEALAASTPVISTKGAPWAGLSEHRCGWWIDHGTEPLVGALREAMTMPREALMAMGTRGRAWMARDFSWDRVAADMIEVYRWLKGARDRPQHVSIEV